MSVHPRNPRQILVFLPVAAARTIVATLEEHGYEAAAVSTVPDAFDALRSDRYSLAVATRPDIDLVRAIQSIPVLNLEIFFHAVPSGVSLAAGSKCFDGAAFLKRVDSLSKPSAAKHDQHPGKQKKVEPVTPTGASRWLCRLKSLLKVHRIPMTQD